MSGLQSKVQREARKMLKDSGLDHEFRIGSRHIKLYIENELALVMSKSDTGKDCKLVGTIIKRKLACN